MDESRSRTADCTVLRHLFVESMVNECNRDFSPTYFLRAKWSKTALFLMNDDSQSSKFRALQRRSCELRRL